MTYNIRSLVLAGVIGSAALLAVLFNAGFVSAATAGQLEPGMSSDAVTALQNYLKADPTIYPQGLVTGYYGPLTVAAVQRFQCKNGIV